MVGMCRPQSDTRAVVEPKAPTFGLSGWHFQPLTSPDPRDTLLVHRPAGSAKQRRDPAVSVAAILTGELNNVGRQSGLIIRCRWDLALRRSMLSQHVACPSLGDAKLGPDM